MQTESIPSNNRIATESWPMLMARGLGLRKIAWSLRRLHCPVDPHALVLEVGSGGNPYFRANVLVDAYEETGERHWAPLVSDRPTVLAFAERLPFKDKAFDFVVASHVLEHSPDPAGFLEEMQRVARAGYIEVPDAFMERINPYPDHRLEITVRQGKLRIRRKSSWMVDPELVELYEDRAKDIIAREVIPGHPFAFHVRFYWRDRIEYEIVNPESSSQDLTMPSAKPGPFKNSLRGIIQSKILSIIRSLFSQNNRNQDIDLLKLLRCPNCFHEDLHRDSGKLVCQNCGAHFLMRGDVPDMTQ